MAALEGAATVVSAGSVADELEKLASLRNAGILTDDEFNTKKANCSRVHEHKGSAHMIGSNLQKNSADCRRHYLKFGRIPSQCPSSHLATGSQAGHRYRLTCVTCQPKLQARPATQAGCTRPRVQVVGADAERHQSFVRCRVRNVAQKLSPQ